jgi:hypothetical protein
VPVIDESGFEGGLSHRLAAGTKIQPDFLTTPFAVARARWRWGWRLTWIGRACLILFATVAVISANRESGLLTLGALAQVSSAVRGGVQVGVVFLLLPAGAAFWGFGRWLLRRARGGRLWSRLGPLPVVAPLIILIALTLVHLSPIIGWADITFVVAGLALLVLAYVFVWLDGPNGLALAGFVALVGGVQSLVGVGQFIAQHDLGLRWLGEMVLNPAASGASVLEGSARILRAYGLMRHPNALAAILPLSLLAAISLWARSGGRQRLVWLALMVINTAGLVLSFSRAGWLAALAGLVVLFVAGRQPRGQPQHRTIRFWTPLVLAAGLVVVGAVSLQPALFLGRLLGALGVGTGLEHGAVAERFFSLQGAWTVIARWPLWGVGTRQYVLVVADLIHVAPRESLLVESTPLVLWAELGLAAPLAWLGLGLALVWRGCRRRPAQAANPDLALSTAWIAAVQVVCLFQAFYWPSHELWQGGIWLGIILGLWARASARPAGAARPRDQRWWPAAAPGAGAAGPG